MSGEVVGMMNEAYFVGRIELLAWLNGLLQLNYTKVEQTCSAAAHCQLMDMLYPGKVPMSKVNFNARTEYEYVQNFKILQAVFDKCGIDRHIEVNKLVKGRYMDNLEFLQWMKSYYDAHASGAPYDPVARRGADAKRTIPARPAASAAAGADAAAGGAARVPKASPPKENQASAANKPRAAAGAPGAKKAGGAGASELKQSLAEARLTIDGLEKERDFYFGKLRDIEILVQERSAEAPELCKLIEKILYATDEDFVQEDAPTAPAATTD